MDCKDLPSVTTEYSESATFDSLLDYFAWVNSMRHRSRLVIRWKERSASGDGSISKQGSPKSEDSRFSSRFLPPCYGEVTQGRKQ